MSDENPEGGNPLPHYLVPGAVEGEPQPGQAERSGHVQRGVRAALLILGAAIFLHLVTLVGVELSGKSENAWIFLPEGLLVVVGALVAAIVITLRLPNESRVPFWIAGIACMFFSVLAWGATCAMAL
jgi:hypothetical protein